MREGAWRVVLYLSLAGAGLASYLTAVTFVTADLSYCAPHPLFSCETVLRSAYSMLFGVPVALLGLLGFVALFLAAYGVLTTDGVVQLRFARFGLGLALVGLAFGTFLTYIELFVIGSVCLLCLASFLLIFPILYLIVTAGRRGLNGVAA